MYEVMDIQLKEELSELVSLVSEIDYEQGDFQMFQRAGALAFNDLVEEFTRTGTCKNKALLALGQRDGGGDRLPPSLFEALAEAPEALMAGDGDAEAE
jgi:hypothetical protein